MRCFWCGNTNPEHVEFCTYCGVSFENRCLACGAGNPTQAQFCGSCGHRLASQSTGPSGGAGEEGTGSSWTEPMGSEQAERRQLTVLFCDLVDSTSLSERLDPEELGRLLGAFHNMCSLMVTRHGGQVAQYLGDGVLVYFGHPLAHEDDAQRAVRAALSIKTEMEKLNQGFQREGGPQLSFRMGIHTGEVVLRQDRLAVGETPNIAARAQNLADPDTIVMTVATYKLVEGYFNCKDLGLHTLKGLARKVQMYHVTGETERKGRPKSDLPVRKMPVVGRELETNFLMETWQRIRAGTGQTVLLRGEPGIGKSRLTEVLKSRLGEEKHSLLECYCLAYDQLTAFAPITHLLRRIFGFDAEDSPEMKLSKLSSVIQGIGLGPEETVPLLAPLVSIPSDAGYSVLEMTPIRARQLTLEALKACLISKTRDSKVLIIVEDLQWMDPSSLELIGLLMKEQGAYPFLMVMTSRPDFQIEWPTTEGMHVLNLTRLTQEQTALVVRRVAHERTLPPEVLNEVVTRTDGVPLFVEELTKTILESGLLRAVNGSYELSGPLPLRAIPATVQDSLMARLDRLGSAKNLAQLGATIGRDFRHDILLAVAKAGEVEIEHDLNRLTQSDLVSRQGVPPRATYSFRHALVQDTAYQSLLKSTRVLYHERIAGVLFEHFPDVVENQPELLAQHYTAAGASRQAVTYWQKAGVRAMGRSANEEARGHFSAGLDLLERLPDDGTRRAFELEMQVNLGLSITGSSGYAVPAVGEAYQRARELCSLLGNTAEFYPVLRNLCTFYIVRDDLENAKELAEQCLRLGQETGRADYLIEGFTALGYVLSYMGKLKDGTELLDNAVQAYRSRDGRRLTYPTAQEPGVASLCLIAVNRWMLGDSSHAEQCQNDALALAEELGRPFDIAYAHCYVAMLFILRGDFRRAIHHANLTIEISQKHGFIAWLNWGTGQLAIAKGKSGETAEAIELLKFTLAALQAGGGEISISYFLAGLAEVYWETGNVEEALLTIEKAIEHAEQYGEHWYEGVLYRFRGEFRAFGEGQDIEKAKADLTLAINIAHQQGAKLFEVQAALSLFKLCLEGGQLEPSRTMLNSAFEAVPPDARDIPALKEAKRLLKQFPKED